ncbi:aldo/keto reductase [Phakopsora pachyrhizi]|nr:aldo/keto reductase [Phakopsora pachyrhizi]
MARVDKDIPIKEVIKTLKTLIKEGKFKHIGLSEVSPDTICRAHAVHPISAVKMEYSPWALGIEQNGVLSTCKELGIPIVAYSPLGCGMLTGKFKSPDDLPEGDMRRHFDRFSHENFHHNLKERLTEQIQSIAKRIGLTAAQVCLSWILSQSKIIIPIPGSTRLEGIDECLGSSKVKLEDEDLKELRRIIDGAQIKGVRYSGKFTFNLYLKLTYSSKKC